MQSRNSNNLKGIDISNHQGNIDFAKVKAAGIDIVYMKATEGVGYIDPFFESNYANAKAVGLNVGFYHFFTPQNEADTANEVQAFINAIKDKQADCKHVLDIENTKGLDKDTLSNLAKLWLDGVKQITGKDVVLYTYTGFAKNNLTDALENYPLWIAHYGVNTPGDNPIWNSWIGFQYSSTGSIDGISSNVDMDEFTKDILINETVISVNDGSKPKVDSEVLKLQHVLNMLKIRDGKGNTLAEDGILGNYTKEAVKRLQNICGLSVDGIAGPQTWGVINSILAKPFLKINVNGIATKYVQFRVGTTYDGIFGWDTNRKVAIWQGQNGLTQDGIVGPMTWNKLFN